MAAAPKIPPHHFVKWIMACVSSVYFTIHMNGSESQKIEGGRGLRQGDPLSPILFVIVMEYFSRLMKGVSQRSDYHHHPGCKQLNISHIMFADDLLIFSRPDKQSLEAVMSALKSFEQSAGLRANLQKSQLVLGGCNSYLQQQALQITGLPEHTFPLKYLGVPITASRLTKLECRSLVEKMTARVQLWSTRNISYAGRARLINNVLFGMFAYWASIFIMPKEILVQLTKLCRNYLWGGSAEYKNAPHVSWQQACKPKKHGGLGLTDLETWNRAKIASAVWAVAEKRDLLWVKWVHERYLKNTNWWEYSPRKDSSWCWRKICKVKDDFHAGRLQQPWTWDTCRYKVSKGYTWLMGGMEAVNWQHIIWAKPNIPRAAFISWVAIHNKLPTTSRLASFGFQSPSTCVLCRAASEDQTHLFFTCVYARQIWEALHRWWDCTPMAEDMHSCIQHLLGSKIPRRKLHITSTVITSAVYFIWYARNSAIFKGTEIAAHATIQQIKCQVRDRFLFIATANKPYTKYIDRLIS